MIEVICLCFCLLHPSVPPNRGLLLELQLRWWWWLGFKGAATVEVIWRPWISGVCMQVCILLRRLASCSEMRKRVRPFYPGAPKAEQPQSFLIISLAVRNSFTQLSTWNLLQQKCSALLKSRVKSSCSRKLTDCWYYPPARKHRVEPEGPAL